VHGLTATTTAPPPSTLSTSTLGSVSASADPSGTAPAGYGWTTDPAGFALDVPDGFYRSNEPPRIFYYSPGKQFRLGIRQGSPDPSGPVGVMQAEAAQGPQTYQGYHDASVTPTTRDGDRAALWEFTWDGFGDGGGPRRTLDLCWVHDGTQYDVWVSAPLTATEQGRAYFETAEQSFRPG
jgi:hypothetical protein